MTLDISGDNEFEARARALVQDGSLGYDQKVRRLAALATETLPYPLISAACEEALSKRVICDMYEGNAPFTARYLSFAFPGWSARVDGERVDIIPESPSGLITFDVVGGREAGQRFVESTEIAQLATSLGGPETLVTHPASTTHAGLLPEELADAGIGEGTIRLSVGLEHADDLLADLRQALDASMRA